jgi:sarcosine oxidase subunit gamma
MAEQTVRRSPLADAWGRLADVSRACDGAVSIEEIPFLAQVNLRLDPKGPAADAIGLELGLPLPTEPNTSTRSGDLAALWLGPDEWLILGPAGTNGDLEARLRTAAGGAHASVADVSAQRTTLVIAGPCARDLLAQGCTLDLHPRAFGDGSCAQTTLARAQVVLVGHGPAYRVLVRASFAAYLADWLIDASLEFTGPPISG